MADTTLGGTLGQMGGTLADYAKQQQGLVEDRWKHRSAEMRCTSCMYFVPKVETPHQGLGRCRRHAPSVAQGWPAVFQDDWCGDHKLR